MRKVKRFLVLITLTVITFSSYKLLLTVQNMPTTNIQNTGNQHQERVNSINLNYVRDHSTLKRTLRQLLQDNEITQLPVRVTTDCHSSPDQSPHRKSLQFITINTNAQDSDTICLNETRLYEESLVQHGVPFDQLSVLEQKASIVRTVLSDLEYRNKLDELDHKNKLLSLDDSEHKNNELEAKVNMFDAHIEHGLKSDKETAEYISEQELERSKNKVPKVKVDKSSPFPNKTSDGLVVLSHGPKIVRKPQPKGSRLPPAQVLSSSNVAPSARKQKKMKIARSMNADLKKFKGVRVSQNLDLTTRGFPSEWEVNSTLVRDRLKHITMAIDNTFPSERSVTATSLNPNLLERAKFQHDQVNLFCRQHTHPSSNMPLEDTELDSLFRHLLYDDSRKIVFCYVPKNGCSNMKRMMLVLNGILPPEASKEKRPAESVLKEVRSFHNLTRAEATYRLQNYLKLAIVRNPLERLLSAYKNKLEKPFVANLRKVFPDRLKAFILKKYRRKEFEAWIAQNNSTEDIHPSFDEFIQFMNNFPLSMYNEHFEPFLELCNPCAIKFDFFLSFKILAYDIYAFMEYLKIPFGLYPESIAHKSEPTASFLEEYYAVVSPDTKAHLFRRFSREFEFYYSLHPEEWGMNSHL